MFVSVKRVLRYFTIYGFYRTLIKIAGRTRRPFLRFLFVKIFIPQERNISLIGCGQFGFSTISYFLLKKVGNRFLECYDPNTQNQTTTAKFWGYKPQEDAYKLIKNPDCKYIYIASNHASHTDYAISALRENKIVYVEKPISVNYTQFKDLLELKKYRNNLFVGYNRPFSKAIIELNKYINGSLLPITLNCFVIGHFINKDHWYRKPEEGTRICGNVGHWIDLSINLLNTRGAIPTEYKINIAYSNQLEFDDNISITITTELSDLITIIISSRAEPFEGINESIQFQSGEVIAKIDDFRNIDIWNASEKKHIRFRKDVGHFKAINQPFIDSSRKFQEIEISTTIMLEITNMVVKNETFRLIRPNEIIIKLLNESH